MESFIKDSKFLMPLYKKLVDQFTANCARELATTAATRLVRSISELPAETHVLIFIYII